MRFQRSSGILLHITSLPGGHGIGDLGPEARSFADFLAESGQKIWQVLPLSPTGYGDSPYQCFSAFAGNPLLIDLSALAAEGFLEQADLDRAPQGPPDFVDYGSVIRFKQEALATAARRFFRSGDSDLRRQYDAFCLEHAAWLDDFALFMARKNIDQNQVWTEWEPDLRARQPEALQSWRLRLADEIGIQNFAQFQFFRQWHELKAYCRQRSIRIMGDTPIYVAHDSADVWSHPDLFQLDEVGRPAVVAGVPPDYFSATGQLWGNPIYHWDRLAQNGYQWWIERLKATLRLVDMVRLDHFRGFEAYWEIPGRDKTAAGGKWVKGPGADLFRALHAALGSLPIVAENLGVITPEVEAIREEFGFPGMSLLQFAFGNDPQGPSFRPHNYARNHAAYTGVHDNDTTVGWWNSAAQVGSIRTGEDIRKEREFTRAYLNFEDEPIEWVFIRAVMASVADTAVVPMQDVLGLGAEARMNLPGTTSGNWRWRFRPGALRKEHSDKLRAMAFLYDR